MCVFFFFSSRRRHTIFKCDWSSDVCSSDLLNQPLRSADLEHTRLLDRSEHRDRMTLHVLHEDAYVRVLHVASPQKFLDNDFQLAGSQPCSLRGSKERKGYLAVSRDPQCAIQV